MGTIRLTSKRQATLPRELCEEMRIGPGDLLIVERVEHDGESLWCLRASRPETPSWFGSLRKYAKDKPHDMESIRKSIAVKREND